MATDTTPTPSFVLVKSSSPYSDGRFGVAAGKPGESLRFTREWRCLQLGDEDDLENNTISKATWGKLNAEPFLACKPATQAEVDAHLETQALSADSKDQMIAELKTKQAELEGRLMRLEQGGKKVDPKGSSDAGADGAKK